MSVHDHFRRPCPNVPSSDTAHKLRRFHRRAPSRYHRPFASTRRCACARSPIRERRDTLRFRQNSSASRPPMTICLLASTASSPTSLRRLDLYPSTGPATPSPPTRLIVPNGTVPPNHMTPESCAPPIYRPHPHTLLDGMTLTPFRGPAPDLAPSSSDPPPCILTHRLAGHHGRYHRTESPTTTPETPRLPPPHHLVHADRARHNPFDPTHLTNSPTAHYSVIQLAHDVAPGHAARPIASAHLRATANLARDATARSSHTGHHTFNYDTHRILRLRHSQ